MKKVQLQISPRVVYDVHEVVTDEKGAEERSFVSRSFSPRIARSLARAMTKHLTDVLDDEEYVVEPFKDMEMN